MQSGLAFRSLTRGLRASVASVRVMAAVRPMAASFTAASFGKGMGCAAPRVVASPAAWGVASLRPMSVQSGDGATRDAAATLFVGNLPWSVDDASLKSIFSEFPTTDSKVIFDMATGRSKGIAFVNFQTPEEANRAAAKLNGMEVDGRNIRVEPRTPPGTERPRREFAPRGDRADRPPRPRQENDDRKLYVGNLAWAVDNLDLEDIFKEFGKVESAQVVMDRETGRSKGFGFVVMDSKENSEKAKAELSGANVDGRTIVVDFASKPVE
jgi:nucleolin